MVEPARRLWSELFVTDSVELGQGRLQATKHNIIKDGFNPGHRLFLYDDNGEAHVVDAHPGHGLGFTAASMRGSKLLKPPARASSPSSPRSSRAASPPVDSDNSEVLQLGWCGVTVAIIAHKNGLVAAWDCEYEQGDKDDTVSPRLIGSVHFPHLLSISPHGRHGTLALCSRSSVDVVSVQLAGYPFGSKLWQYELTDDELQSQGHVQCCSWSADSNALLIAFEKALVLFRFRPSSMAVIRRVTIMSDQASGIRELIPLPGKDLLWGAISHGDLNFTEAADITAIGKPKPKVDDGIIDLRGIGKNSVGILDSLMNISVTDNQENALAGSNSSQEPVWGSVHMFDCTNDDDVVAFSCPTYGMVTPDYICAMGGATPAFVVGSAASSHLSLFSINEDGLTFDCDHNFESGVRVRGVGYSTRQIYALKAVKESATFMSIGIDYNLTLVCLDAKEATESEPGCDSSRNEAQAGADGDNEYEVTSEITVTNTETDHDHLATDMGVMTDPDFLTDEGEDDMGLEGGRSDMLSVIQALDSLRIHLDQRLDGIDSKLTHQDSKITRVENEVAKLQRVTHSLLKHQKS